MDNNIIIEELRGQITKLRAEVDSLSQSFYKNNFSSSQVFNKDVSFQTRLRIPVLSAAPYIGEVGDLIQLSTNGKLYICTVASTSSVGATFTDVATQTSF